MENGVISSIIRWFSLAVPKPTPDNQRVQFGVHVEEFSEMLDAVKSKSLRGRLRLAIARWATKGLATDLKTNKMDVYVDNRLEYLDSCCDQIVTALGCAHMHKMDVVTGMQRVSDSNWSKFTDGVPEFDENGKIKKGKGYYKPTLIDLV